MRKKRESARDVYQRRYEAIRQYVSFPFPRRLDRRAKLKITKYANAIHTLTARTYKAYFPRDKRVLRAAQEFAQHEEYLPDLKVAFVPVASVEGARISYHKRKDGTFSFKVNEGPIVRQTLLFDQKQLARNTKQHVQATLAKAPKTAKSFSIQAGQYEITKGTLAKGRVLPRIEELMERYSVGGKRYKGGRNSNHWRNWLYGVNAYSFKQQKTIDTYFIAKRASNETVQTVRKAARRKK